MTYRKYYESSNGGKLTTYHPRGMRLSGVRGIAMPQAKAGRCRACHEAHRVKGQYLLFCGKHQKVMAPRDSCPDFRKAPAIPSKMHNIRSIGPENLTELAGRSFQSGLERDRAVELVYLQRAGHIQNLRFQASTRLTKARLQYTPDFCYQEKGNTVYEEAKGRDCYPWTTYRRLWKYYGEGELRVMRRGPGRTVVFTESICGEGKFEK